jgi:NAD(P)-dependent dehydrogenase (short-subunit alcohol dehydrogenase family)
MVNNGRQRHVRTPGTARRLASGRLEGALVLVTGAGRGIGRATASSFARRGGRVLAVDVDAAAAEQTAAACAGAAFGCDVADWEAVAALADRIHAEHGPLDVLVNNAGVGMTGGLTDVSIADWRWIRSINIDGVVHGCRAFGPAMVARGAGQVVNVSSGLGYTPRATEPAYVTTKAAVLALSQCLRADWSTHGVGVSVICPGVIDTSIVRSSRFLGARDAPDVRARAERLFGRGHAPEMVAEAIVDAVRRDRAVVPVGWEARLGWWGHRFTPIAVQQRVARGVFV